MKKSKAQGRDTDTSLEGWESNTCLGTPMPLSLPLCHTFSPTDSRKRSLYIGVGCIMVNLAIGGHAVVGRILDPVTDHFYH